MSGFSVLRDPSEWVGLSLQPGDSEAPQLYFNHMLKRGDAHSLAAEIRQRLNLTRSK